jgi:hypothetical protein
MYRGCTALMLPLPLSKAPDTEKGHTEQPVALLYCR